MATVRRPFGPALESKKYDDGHSRPRPRVGSILHSLRTIRRRRIAVAFLALGLLYLFFKHLPTDVAPVSRRYDKFGAQRATFIQPPEKNPNPSLNTDVQHAQDYDGPIQFHKLASTLRGYRFYYGGQDNVLFAFSSLDSASLVVSAACTMAHQNRTKVHVARLGRHDVNAKELLELNGIPENECPTLWHDARPDHALESSTERMAASVQAALQALQRELSLNAILFDDSGSEDDFFLGAIKSQAKPAGTAAIPLPNRDAWMFSLDGHSLREWQSLSIDIVIQASSEASGNLIRLLKSIQRADYSGLTHPKLIIELPAHVDQALSDFIAGYRWPPHASYSERRLFLRRNPDPKLSGSIERSLLTLETFYPPTLQSHVLLLAPEVELASSFYQVLMFQALEYKAGARAAAISSRLFGISLEPSNANQATPVSLSQAIEGSAVLFFGDRWNELHNFVTLRLYADPEWERTVATAFSPEKAPAWLQAISELLQAQGMFMLHVNPGGGASPLITVHNEIASARASGRIDVSDLSAFSIKEKSDVLVVDEDWQKQKPEHFMLATASVTSLLGEQERSLAFDDVSVIDHSGKLLTWKEVDIVTKTFRESFAKTVGGCQSVEHLEQSERSEIGRLFCI